MEPVRLPLHLKSQTAFPPAESVEKCVFCERCASPARCAPEASGGRDGGPGTRRQSGGRLPSPPAADGASASCRALRQAGPGPARRRCRPCSASLPAGQTAEHTLAADSAAGGRRAVQQRRATPVEAPGAASHSGSGSGCARGLGSRSSARAWTATPASGIRSENRGDGAKPRTQGLTLIDQATANPTSKGVEEVIRGSSTEGRGCAC